MQVRRLIAAALWTFGLLAIVAMVSAGVWFVLHSVGDRQGAAGARAVAIVASVCAALDFVALVVMLALAFLRQPPDDGRG